MLSDYPALAKEFHPSKNLPLTPDTVPANYSKKVWWLLPYDDPRTGKHFDFEWQAGVNQRTLKGYGCPYLSGRAVWPGFNDLQTMYPGIASEWHPTKNGDLLPSEIAYGSGKKVWWLLPYDDPSTGKHFDFEWESTVNSRTSMNAGCPYLAGAVWSGFNDLATKNPELAKEWSGRNELSPSEVTEWSNMLVWWHMPYDDPETGKHFEFEWQARVSRRSMGDGCPYLSGAAVWTGFNDLQTLYPKIASEWHPTKNKMKASEVQAYSNQKGWWLLSYDDPRTGKHFDFEWEMAIAVRTYHGQGCPYLAGKKVYPGFNDLASCFPQYAKEWHPIKNKLSPEEVTPYSSLMVWWYLPYDDPLTGKHFDFEWEASVRGRISNDSGCPYLSNSKVWKGFNDLATTHPELAKEWHPKNTFSPDSVTYGTAKEAWWLLPYDDPITGKHFDFEWKTSILSRTSDEYGCPYLSGRAVWPGFNDLATTHPKLAKQWHPLKNGDKKPEQYSFGSHEKVWWYLPYDDTFTGKHFDFEWEAMIEDRAIKGIGCPYLSNYAVHPGYNDLATTHPELAKEWSPKNKLKPEQVTFGSNTIVWWILPYDDKRTGKHFDFEWEATVNSRQVNGCPFLSNVAVWPGFNDLATTHPDLAKEWNHERNRLTTVDKVSASSGDKAWWKCAYGHEWYESISYRARAGSICPECRKARRGIFIN